MARQNQAAFVTIIILVLLLIVAGVVAFLGISNANQLKDELASAEEKQAAAQKQSQAFQIETQVLKAYIGTKGDADSASNAVSDLTNMGQDVSVIQEEVNTSQAAFDKASARFSFGEGKKATYLQIIDHLKTAHDQIAVKYSVEKKDKKRIAEEKDQEIAAKEAERLKALADLQNARTSYEANLANLNTQITGLTSRINELDTENKAAKELAQNDLSAIQSVLVTEQEKTVGLETQLVTLKDKVNRYEREVFEHPDGIILGISPENRMVIVDRGSDHGLKVNRTFSIFGKNTSNFQKGAHKATIEITRVHKNRAEARIVDVVDPRDPINRNDYILNPIWDSGFTISVALAGDFDTDGDGITDLPRLMQQIRQHGGEISAYVDVEGNILNQDGDPGTVDAGTRYIVLGNNAPEGSQNLSRINNAVSKLRKDAAKFEVQEITVQKLYERMGVVRRARIERTDSRIGEQFRKRNPGDAILESGSDTNDGSGTTGSATQPAGSSGR